MSKKIATPDDLSGRDREILDRYAAGEKRKDLAAAFAVSVSRVEQVIRRPASVAYLAQLAGSTKTLLYAKAGEELLARMDWGGMKLPDLLAIWKAAMPQELNVNVAIEQAARIVAERRGLTAEQTATIIDLASRRKAS